MSFDRKYVACALSYAIVGMALGIFMAASNNHSQFVTHAHILLVGFLLSFCYGIIHKLWLVQPNIFAAKTQFVIHQIAAISMFIGLFLLYSRAIPAEKIEPILGIASMSVFVGALIMLYMIVQSKTAEA